MSYFIEQQEIFNQPIRLSHQETEQPITVFQKYFQDYYLCDTRHNLWEMVMAGITSDNPYFADPSNRADLLLFYERIEQVLEAAFIISISHQEGS